MKTAHWKEMGPYDPDWYYTRAASVARHVYLTPTVGVGKLRKMYGGRKSNGTCPEHHAKGAGGLLRHILQELERVGIVELNESKGRQITVRTKNNNSTRNPSRNLKYYVKLKLS